MNKDISIELVNSIAAEEITSVGLELGEITIDTVLREGLFRDIPILNTITALSKAGIEIRHQLFMQKIVNFLRGFSDTPLAKRREFVEKVGQGSKKQRELGEIFYY